MSEQPPRPPWVPPADIDPAIRWTTAGETPATEEHAWWRPKPVVPRQKIEEGPTWQMPLVGPRRRPRRWTPVAGAGLVAGLLLAGSVVFGLQVGNAMSPTPPPSHWCVP